VGKKRDIWKDLTPYQTERLKELCTILGSEPDTAGRSAGGKKFQWHLGNDVFRADTPIEEKINQAVIYCKKLGIKSWHENGTIQPLWYFSAFIHAEAHQKWGRSPFQTEVRQELRRLAGYDPDGGNCDWAGHSYLGRWSDDFDVVVVTHHEKRPEKGWRETWAASAVDWLLEIGLSPNVTESGRYVLVDKDGHQLKYHIALTVTVPRNDAVRSFAEI
jgi:hypothetical protein